MSNLFRRALPWAAALSMLLSACGGGTSPSSAPPADPDAGGAPPPISTAFTAFGSSARTASLAWAPPTGVARIEIERRRDGDPYETVASVDAQAGAYLDAGLAPNTAYQYRLVAAGADRRPLAEQAVATGDEEPVVTPAGSALGAEVTAASGTGAVSPDGRIALQWAADALPAGSQARLQPVGNTAPAGRGDALRVRLDAAPSRTLTLTLRYAEAQDDEADALRIALQRPDGRWTSLPLASIDKATRTLTAELPAGALAVPGGPAAAAEVSVEFTIAGYVGFELKPAEARVKVGHTLALVPYARVRGHETSIGVCVRFAEFEACVMQPVMESREIPLRNQREGYARAWTVAGVPGGDAAHGTVAPNGSIGAVYTAPAQVPSPPVVRVAFTSRALDTGRTVKLVSRVEVWDDHWSGTMSALTPPSYAGTVFLATANLSWAADAAASTATRKVYRAQGEIEVQVTDDDCTVAISPAVQPVSADVRLVELVVDEGAVPMTYQAKLITFWQATISASCPKGGATQTTQTAGYGWEVQGYVSPDGRLIEGGTTSEDGTALEWRFTR